MLKFAISPHKAITKYSSAKYTPCRSASAAQLLNNINRGKIFPAAQNPLLITPRANSPTRKHLVSVLGKSSLLNHCDFSRPRYSQLARACKTRQKKDEKNVEERQASLHFKPSFINARAPVYPPLTEVSLSPSSAKSKRQKRKLAARIYTSRRSVHAGRKGKKRSRRQGSDARKSVNKNSSSRRARGKRSPGLIRIT